MDNKTALLGPSYLEGITEDVDDDRLVEKFEWRKKLRTTHGQTRFKIKYYGDLRGQHIVSTPFAAQKVIAIDNKTGKEILLFDGCIHGYNAMFCDAYTQEQINNREVNKIYTSEDGYDEFEVMISAYYQIDYDEELHDDVDENGLIELINGSLEKYENVKRNGFDVLQILLLDKLGRIYEAITEELA